MVIKFVYFYKLLPVDISDVLSRQEEIEEAINNSIKTMDTRLCLNDY